MINTYYYLKKESDRKINMKGLDIMKEKEKTTLSCIVEKNLKDEITARAKAQGSSVSEWQRRALRNGLSTGMDDAVAMCAIIELQQTINDLKSGIPKEEYEKMQECMALIMKAKGGNRNGSI